LWDWDLPEARRDELKGALANEEQQYMFCFHLFIFITSWRWWCSAHIYLLIIVILFMKRSAETHHHHHIIFSIKIFICFAFYDVD